MSAILSSQTLACARQAALKNSIPFFGKRWCDVIRPIDTRLIQKDWDKHIDYFGGNSNPLISKQRRRLLPLGRS